MTGFYQTGRNITVLYKPEVTFGTAPSATGATVFRASSGGSSLSKQPINSNENRRDGMVTRGRHGQRIVQGQYSADLSVGTFDPLIEAAMRGTWVAASNITPAAMSSATITTTSSTIVASAGSWITAGLRVGDVIVLTNHSTVGNNSRNLRVTGLTASTISTAETLTVDAAPDATWNIAIAKRLIMGDPYVSRSFTFEEFEADSDMSEYYTGCRIGSMGISLQPNSMAQISFALVGQNMTTVSGASAPYFTSSTATTSLGLTAVEAQIRLGNNELLDVTGADLQINLNAQPANVVGSVVTPDVFTNLAQVSGSITALRRDLTRVTEFLNETGLSLWLTLAENMAEPRNFISFFIPNITLASATKSPMGQDGPRSQQIALLIGVDERGGAFDKTMVRVSTSAP